MADTYVKTQWSNNATALSAENMNHIEQGISDAHDLIEQIVNSKIEEIILDSHPVGSIEINTTGTNPSDYLGGTWVAWGQGRVPVGVGTSDRTFNANETGGSSDPVLPSHTHTFRGNALPAHNHTQYSHNHSQNSHSHGTNNTSGFDRFVLSKSSLSFGNDTGGSISGSGFSYPRTSGSSGGSATTTENGFSRGSATGSATATNVAATAVNIAASAGTPSGTNDYTGVADTSGKNLQPYVTCYMWKRTE